MTGVLKRGQGRNTQGEHHMTEAEAGILHLKAKECQGLTTTTRSSEAARRGLYRVLEGGQSCRALGFILLASKTVTESISVAVSHLVCVP